MDEKKLLEGAKLKSPSKREGIKRLRIWLGIVCLIGGCLVFWYAGTWIHGKQRPTVTLEKFQETGEKLQALQHKLEKLQKTFEEKVESYEGRLNDLKNTLERAPKDTVSLELREKFVALKNFVDGLKKKIPEQVLHKKQEMRPEMANTVQKIFQFVLVSHLRRSFESSHQSACRHSWKSALQDILRTLKRGADAELKGAVEALETLLTSDKFDKLKREYELFLEGTALLAREKADKIPEGEALKAWAPPPSSKALSSSSDSSWAQRGFEYLFSFVKLEKVEEKQAVQESDVVQKDQAKTEKEPSSLRELIEEVQKRKPLKTSRLGIWFQQAQDRESFDTLFQNQLRVLEQLCEKTLLSLGEPSVPKASTVPMVPKAGGTA